MVSVRLPRMLQQELEELVEGGFFISLSEALKYAGRNLLEDFRQFNGGGDCKVRSIAFWVPDVLLEGIDELVKNGLYSSRGEVVREAVLRLLRRELWNHE